MARRSHTDPAGRLVARLPSTQLYTQYPGWAAGRWRYGGSIFDGYQAHRHPEPRTVSRVVVTLGTHEKFHFPRLLDRLVRIIPSTAEVLWQVGSTVVPKMPAGARRQVPFAEMRQAMREADVVVTHTGYTDPALRARKLQRDLRLLRLDLADDLDEPFTNFNMGSVLQELGRHEEARVGHPERLEDPLLEKHVQRLL